MTLHPSLEPGKNPLPPGYVKEFFLPSGRMVRMRQALGVHLLMMLAGLRKNPDLEIEAFLMTQLMEIEDKLPTYTEVLAMEIRDFAVLLSHITEIGQDLAKFKGGVA